MSRNTVPDEGKTRTAVTLAERAIASGDLRDEEKSFRHMVTVSVLEGDSLAEAWFWALGAALVRDARPTLDEMRARRMVAA